MRILYIPKNIDASGFYRCFFPAGELSERGHEARTPPWPSSVMTVPQQRWWTTSLPDGWVNAHFGEWPDAEIFVFQMPLDENAPEIVDQLHQAHKKVVVELDDDYLHLPPYNPFNGDARHMHRCVQKADAVCVSTPSLQRSYKHLNKNITVLRNRLYWPMWEEITPVYEQTWKRIRVGYMGRLDFHSADLDVIRPWFGKWLVRHPEVEFVAAGDPRIHDYLGVPDRQRVTTDSVDYRHLELAYVTAVFDIGLVPLAKNRFNEGKSYLKGLEYSACGIVPVCTPSEQYREFVNQGQDGFLVDAARDWQQVLDQLVSDREEVRRLGMEARRKAKEWTYQRHIQEHLDFFETLSQPDLLWDTGNDHHSNPAGAGALAPGV
jgi:hypothetical protein